MNSMYCLILIMLFCLTGCDQPEDQVAEEGQEADQIQNPICNEASTNCDMNWVVTYPRDLFPASIQILVNKKVIFTECGDTNFSVNRMQSTVEIMMWNYRRLAPQNKTKFSFEIRNVLDCNDLDTAETFDQNNPQRYALEEIGNTTRVLIQN